MDVVSGAAEVEAFAVGRGAAQRARPRSLFPPRPLCLPGAGDESLKAPDTVHMKDVAAA